MKRTTHTLLGAAVVVPLALAQEPALAAGCLWLGMAGAGLPDWLDLRSDFRATLRHRGVSHSLLALAACVGVTWFMLRLFQANPIAMGEVDLSLSRHAVRVLTIALGLGFLSHLAADACTVAGIRPLLPFTQWRVWLLPRPLRGRTGGPLDTGTRWLAVTVLAFGLVLAASRALGAP
jgi:membrane-bound metal-dependent hydrolase YbcI (DUF457 family)